MLALPFSSPSRYLIKVYDPKVLCNVWWYWLTLADQEMLRCNVCNLEVEMSKAKEHALAADHVSLKSRLEQDLAQVERKDYSNGESVVLQWKKSVDPT